MGKYISYLKISCKIEIVFGLLSATFMSFFIGVMATDAPTSTVMDFIFGAILGFVIIAFPLVLAPFLALIELNKYEIKRKLLFNIINTIVCFFFLAPLSFFQFYMLYKITNKQNKTV